MSASDGHPGERDLNERDLSDPNRTDLEPRGITPEGSEPNDADGQFNSQDMPTTDGQMASGTSEEVIPPRAD